jgi:cysteine desulfurase
MKRVVYLDNNATTKVAGEVLEEMLPYLTELYGNPSSMHSFGGQVEKKIKAARESVSALIGCSSQELVFTSCGTESDNAAIRGVLEANPAKRHIITTKVEHPAVLNLCKYLQRLGYYVTYLSVDRQGMLDLDELKDSIRSDTAILSIMWANNETGTLFPVERIAAIAREKGVLFHCDAVQAAGKIPIDMAGLPIDLLSISGHKIHAPKGVAALYIRRGTRFNPFLIGGHQEKGRRGGTENVASIIGFGKAAELAGESLGEEMGRVKYLRTKLETALLKDAGGCRLNGHPTERLPNTCNVSFEFVEGEGILLLLDEAGIAASSGSACTSGSLEPSHVLRAMGVPFTCAHGSIRFSLSRYTTEEEIDYVIQVVPSIIRRLREISPFALAANARKIS